MTIEQSDPLSSVSAITLSHIVAVYCPTKDKNNKPLPQATVEEIITHVAGVLSDVNGGATATDALGFWRLPNGQLCREKVCIVYSFCESLEPCLQAVFDLATWVKDTANQDMVSVEVDRRMVMV